MDFSVWGKFGAWLLALRLLVAGFAAAALLLRPGCFVGRSPLGPRLACGSAAPDWPVGTLAPGWFAGGTLGGRCHSSRGSCGSRLLRCPRWVSSWLPAGLCHWWVAVRPPAGSRACWLSAGLQGMPLAGGAPGLRPLFWGRIVGIIPRAGFSTALLAPSQPWLHPGLAPPSAPPLFLPSLFCCSGLSVPSVGFVCRPRLSGHLGLCAPPPRP